LILKGIKIIEDVEDGDPVLPVAVTAGMLTIVTLDAYHVLRKSLSMPSTLQKAGRSASCTKLTGRRRNTGEYPDLGKQPRLGHTKI